MTQTYTLGDRYVVSVEEMDGMSSTWSYIIMLTKWYILEDGDQLTAENTDDSNHDEKASMPLREQDRFLPIANVAKIMKKAIPETGKVNNKVSILYCLLIVVK